MQATTALTMQHTTANELLDTYWVFWAQKQHVVAAGLRVR